MEPLLPRTESLGPTWPVPRCLVRFQMTFLALVSCPLSRWERVRVRAFIRVPWGPSPPALSRWEREREASPAMPKEVA